MTDRERLLEQVREAEERADSVWKWILRPQYRHSVEEVADIAARHAREVAHHALTALALRDAIGVLDEVKYRPWSEAVMQHAKTDRP